MKALSITDNRTGKTYEIPIYDGTFPKYGASIRAADLRKIKAADDDFGLMSYDPGFVNSASCESGITFIDGERGILRYRGYSIEQLAEQSTYLEALTSLFTASCRPNHSTKTGFRPSSITVSCMNR